MPKCFIKNANCKKTDHDACRQCKNAPEMTIEDETESRFLCVVAGQREKQPKYYGVSGGNDPAWFKRLLKKYDGTLGIEDCLDHRRMAGKVVVSEPYNLCMDDIAKLIRFCELNNLTFTIDGDSAHFPGRCFRILISKKDTKNKRRNND